MRKTIRLIPAFSNKLRFSLPFCSPAAPTCPKGSGPWGHPATKRSGAHNAHNYPSQIGEPSHADELITQRLREALALIDVRVIDHLIVAGTSVVSLAESGHL